MTTTREAQCNGYQPSANPMEQGDCAICGNSMAAHATEPQGYVEVTEEMIVAGRKAADDQYYKWRGFGPREEGQGLDGMHFIVREALKAALAARPAPQPAADTRVVVKPLVWVPEDAPCTRFKAEALGGHMIIVELDPKKDPGRYSAGFDLGGLCFKFVLAEYDDFPPKYTAPAKFDTLELAKAAAQADYEARILSAIIGTATPATPSDKIAEAAPDFVADVMRKLRRFQEITEDVEGTGVDIGRDWLDVLTFLGLLDRVQKSPALWQLTDAALRALAGHGETP